MRVSVSGSDLERGEQYLGQAKTRLEEIHKLLGRHDSNVDGSDTSRLIAETTGNLYRDVDSAGQLLAPLAEAGNTEALANLRELPERLRAAGPGPGDAAGAGQPGRGAPPGGADGRPEGPDGRGPGEPGPAARRPAAPGRPGHRLAPRHPALAPRRPPARRPRTPRRASTRRPRARRAKARPSTAPSGAPSSDPSSVHVQVPIGSSDTTFTVPPLISGLPPIGITLGNTAPATGPTTTGAPNTDPNPN